MNKNTKVYVDLPYDVTVPLKVDSDSLKKWIRYKGYIVAMENVSDCDTIFCKWENGILTTALKLIDGESRGISITGDVIHLLPTIEESDNVVLKGKLVYENVTKPITILFDDIIEAPVKIRESYERLIYIRTLGLKTPEFLLFSSVDDFISPIISLLNRGVKRYDVDGVIMCDNTGSDRLIYDIYDEIERASVRDIEWRLTREGRLSPVVILKTASNESPSIIIDSLDVDYICDARIGKGSSLEIIKAGNDVHIMSITKSVNISIPDRCPLCDRKLSNNAGELRCTNIGCIDVGIKKVMYFLKKMGLKGVPESTINRINPLTVEDVYMYFTPTTNRYSRDRTYSRALYSKVRRKIFSLLKTQPYKLLVAFGIPGVSDKIAREIVNHNPQFGKLFSITKPEDVGIKQKDLSKRFLTKIGSFKPLYDFLTLNGMIFMPPPELNLTGFRFSVDRHLGSTRLSVIEEIESMGGYVGPVSNKTDYYITYYGDDGSRWASSSLAKARVLRTRILSWKEYTEIITGKVKPQKKIQQESLKL